MSKTKKIVGWIFRLVVAGILLQTLFFKFTAAPEAVYIFDKVGLGAPGRIGSGVVELMASILLFVPGLTWLGAGLAWGVVSGALIAHLTRLGIVVQNDGGELFILAVIVWILSAVLLAMYRAQIPFLGNLNLQKNPKKL